MSTAKGLTALVFLCVVAACESPTFPDSTTPQVALATAAAPKSTGPPVIGREMIDVTFVFPCQTYDMQQHVDIRIDTKSWVNPDGSTRSLGHLQGRFTFTNLSTGDWAANDIAFNEEVLVSADGTLIQIRNSGVQIKARREAKGKQIAYAIGRLTLTIDFSTMPPTVESSFSGRQDTAGSPCSALGDPA